MKVTEERTQKITWRIKTVCDYCKGDIVLDSFDAFECDMSFKTGTAYPECGSGEMREIDLCPGCAEMVFNHLEKSLGIRVNKSEWDW